MSQAFESLEDGEISPDFDQEQQQEHEVQQAEPPQQQQQQGDCSRQQQLQHYETQQLQQRDQQQGSQQQLQQLQQVQGVQQQQQEQGQLPTAAATAAGAAAAEPAEASSIDPRLNFTSGDFDAGLALQTDGLQLPVPDAPLLDNISRCAGMLQPLDEQQQQQQVQLDGASSAQKVQAKKAKAAAFKQRALQAAQRAEASVKLGSLAAIMSTAAVGPLAVLAKWHAAQQRIYVVTRHASGIRGRAVGTLVGYDKHLNLLLKDVEETYTVIVKVQRVKQQVVQQQQQQQQQQGESTGQQAPVVRTRSRWCRKQQHRHRQLDQILLKGDSIVLVSGTPPQLQPPID